ncbi:hypothetical protein JMJ55_23775 [Belnapia sp. T6]|uniref:Uncharacterized protein n=1 Tax=Belnapia mucosa TaxID=2804532 RepID=A0ABS1VAJ1_9PROT|nr:hypothetical protein [Belnapia mucosa]MBL6458362.1 hypothetical protein [Belnapia mucosa]
MHPELGLALIDTEDRTELPEDRVAVLQERLEQARFGTIFGGHLPILQMGVAPEDLPSLPGILAKAFGELPPLTVGGGTGWVKTMARLVVPADRLWTDNLGGAPPSLKEDEDKEGSGLLRRPAALVPMRRTNPAEDRRAEFERWSRPETHPSSVRGLALGGAAFGLVALAGALAWFAMLPASRGTPATVTPPPASRAAPDPGSVATPPAPPAARPAAVMQPPAPPAASPAPVPAMAVPVALPPARDTPPLAESLPLPPPVPPLPAAQVAPAPQRPRPDGTTPAGRSATPGRTEARSVAPPTRPRPGSASPQRAEPRRGG